MPRPSPSLRPIAAAILAAGALLAGQASAQAATPGAHTVPVPAAAQAVDTSHPNRIVGTGTPASCTSAAVVAAVKAGGIIRFSCGPDPVTIKMSATAKVVNTSAQVVLDGQGKVTLSGQGSRRILYQDSCDPAQTWTTSHCDNQVTPNLVVQNLNLISGNSTGQDFDGGGGGAIFDRGGRLKLVNDSFSSNKCESTGPDIGGAAVRALSQYKGLPLYVVNSSFDQNVCSNGAGLSSIGVSWAVYNSRFTNNRAIGHGANPAEPGTPGGGSGAAIYNDGNTMTLRIAGSTFTGNHATEGGGAIFYVSNDRTGTMSIDQSTLQNNPNDGFQTGGLPGIFFLGARAPTITNTILK